MSAGEGPSKLTWFGSIRIAGWMGGRFAGQPVAFALDALRRCLRGKRRRAAAKARIDRWHAQVGNNETLSLADLLVLLDVVDGEVEDRLVFVDIEIDHIERITQIGVALWVDGVVLLGEGTGDDVVHLDGILGERIAVAHNGDQHDMPRLRSAGLSFDGASIDTLRWSWLAWPLEESHSLGALAQRHVEQGVDVAELHDAVVDAHTLAVLWQPLRDALGRLDAAQRALLRASLGDEVPWEVLCLLLGDDGTPSSLPSPTWRPDTGAAPVAHRVRSHGEPIDPRAGAALVTDQLRSVVQDRPETSLLSAANEVLDPEKVEHEQPGWARAVSARSLTCTRGALQLTPRSARHLVTHLTRSGTEPLLSEGRPVVTDLATLSRVRVEVHTRGQGVYPSGD